MLINSIAMYSTVYVSSGHLLAAFSFIHIQYVCPPSQVLCVLSTTSCFAPRAPDRLLELSELCARFDVPHLVNNAYGLQSAAICHELQRVGEAIVRDQVQQQKNLQRQQQQQHQNGGIGTDSATAAAATNGESAQSMPTSPPASTSPRYRLDVFVQSTDKNLLTPVGGTIIATFDPQILSRVAQTYPGYILCLFSYTDCTVLVACIDLTL